MEFTLSLSILCFILYEVSGGIVEFNRCVCELQMVLVGNLAATFYRLDKRHYNNQAKNRAICGLRLTALH